MGQDDHLALYDPVEFATEMAALGRREPREFRAVFNARRMLYERGCALGYPHTSAVRGGKMGLRELRPRAGRSRYRVLYRRYGDSLVLLALAREALTDPRDFARAIVAAETRARDLLEPGSEDPHV